MGYGKKSWLAVPAAVAGMLLFVGDDSYKVSITPGQGLETSDHLRSAGICCNVCVLPVRECKADRPSVGRRDGSAVYPDFCKFSVSSIWTADRKYGKWEFGMGQARLSEYTARRIYEGAAYPFFGILLQGADQ